jgi:hypothetical protein
MPAHSITLRAQWSTNEYKITYRSTQWVEHANSWS